MRTDEFWTRWQKYRWLEELRDSAHVSWQPITPDTNNTWLTEGLQHDYASHIVLGSGARDDSTVFQMFSNGLKTNRDAWMYNFDRNRLADSVKLTIETYKDDLARWRQREIEPDDLDTAKLRLALYRPFTLMQTYFDPDLNERA